MIETDLDVRFEMFHEAEDILMEVRLIFQRRIRKDNSKRYTV